MRCFANWSKRMPDAISTTRREDVEPGLRAVGPAGARLELERHVLPSRGM